MSDKIHKHLIASETLIRDRSLMKAIPCSYDSFTFCDERAKFISAYVLIYYSGNSRNRGSSDNEQSIQSLGSLNLDKISSVILSPNAPGGLQRQVRELPLEKPRYPQTSSVRFFQTNHI